MIQLYTMITGKGSNRRVLTLMAAFMLVAFFASADVKAQRTVNVTPGFGTLNVAVDGDTTETGARVDSNTVYVLERGGLYLLDGSIEHRNFHLSIVAADGEGDRPRLVPAVGTGGSSRAFRPRGPLTLKGIYVTNEDEQGGLNDRIIRISTNDATISLDDVHLDKASQSAFRVDGSGIKLFIHNSIISNIGTPESPENGRGVDDRGNQMDSLVIENTTFYNLTSQVFRDDGGLINYAKFNQNTVVNTGIGTSVELGPVVEGEYTNNMVINGAFYGYVGESASYVVSISEMTQTEIDSLGAQSLVVSNNNHVTSATITGAYPDSVSASPVYNTVAEAAATESISEEVTFTNAPGLPTDLMLEYYAGAAGTTTFDVQGEPFDFGYTNSFTSYTAGNWGQPLGSIVWHPGVTVSIDDEVNAGAPNGFKLNGNYPNPFNPTTNISINLPAAADVSVEVFNMIGQKVMSIPAQHFGAGANQNLSIDARNLTSGMYLYRVTATAGAKVMTSTGRMTLIK